MARKNRKSQTRQPVLAPAEPAGLVEGPAPQRPKSLTAFNPDYTHVRSDLKRIGLLAGFFILAMIIGAILVR